MGEHKSDPMTLEEFFEGADPQFRPYARLSGDVLEIITSEEPRVARRVDRCLTLYEGRQSGRVVGIVVSGFGELLGESSGQRYFLDRDDSGHWYLVDASRRDEWEAWTNLSEDDERAWEPPGFARALGGCPSRVTFTGPEGHDG